MARFTQYPAASTADYADATTFLIANEDGEIKQASLEGLRDTFGSSLQSASLVIPSAQVLALNTTPQTIVEAQGAGKAIEVISASVKLSFNTTAYFYSKWCVIRDKWSESGDKLKLVYLIQPFQLLETSLFIKLLPQPKRK